MSELPTATTLAQYRGPVMDLIHHTRASCTSNRSARPPAKRRHLPRVLDNHCHHSPSPICRMTICQQAAGPASATWIVTATRVVGQRRLRCCRQSVRPRGTLVRRLTTWTKVQGETLKGWRSVILLGVVAVGNRVCVLCLVYLPHAGMEEKRRCASMFREDDMERKRRTFLFG